MAMKITLKNLRRDFAKLSPETLEYLQKAIPYEDMSRDKEPGPQARMAQLYLSEALYYMNSPGDTR